MVGVAMFDRRVWRRLIWGSGIAIAIWVGSTGHRARSQPSFCQPPPSGAYLLLVDSNTPADQQRVSDLLPPTLQTNICSYQNTTVTRVGSFPNQAIANAWADYISNTLGLESLVVAPGTQLAPAQVGNGSQTNNATYAVLVNFFNRPEIARQLQDILGSDRDIGLVAYAQEHYLLVETTDQLEAANEIMRQLSDRGFWVAIVDNRRVRVLTERVQVTPESSR